MFTSPLHVRKWEFFMIIRKMPPFGRYGYKTIFVHNTAQKFSIFVHLFRMSRIIPISFLTKVIKRRAHFQFLTARIDDQGEV